MSKEQHVIIVPGLGDGVSLVEWSVKDWSKVGVITHVHTAPWLEKDEPFDPKLNRLLKLIDKLVIDDSNLSLVGTSAGGSMVLNAYSQRRDKIHSVVNICGRLRPGENVFPSLSWAARNSPAFYESVVRAEKNIAQFNSKDREKFLIMRSIFDEIVPAATSTLTGAHHRRVPVPGHVFAIGFAIQFMRKDILEHIQSR